MVAGGKDRVIAAREARAREEAGDALLVDVREAYERDDPTVHGAVAAPLFDIITGAAVLPQDRTLIVVDHDGSRAAFGARLLEERGYRAIALDGGARAFTAARD